MGVKPHAFITAQKDRKMSNAIQTTTTTQVAPPMAKKAPLLKDADGNVYLWTEALASRGDLVAGYDPADPDKFAKDSEQITLNRELELARERANAEEVARLEAIKKQEQAEQLASEKEELAVANERRATKAEAELQAERELHAKQMAEMQAKLDAMAEMQAKQGVEKEEVKPKRPAKKTKQVEVTDDLSDFSE